MTTSEPLGGGSPEPHPAYPQQPPAYVYPGATATLPPLPKKPTGLALAALIVGIGAFFIGFVPVVGALAGITAVVLAIFALRKRQSKTLAVIGIVLGSVAALTSIGVTVGVSAATHNAPPDQPAAAIAQPADPTAAKPAETATPSVPAQTTAPAPAPVPVPVPEAQAPVVPEPQAPVPQPQAPQPEAEAPQVPDVPAEYRSALIKAASYSKTIHMSKAGLYDQLTSEYGEQFSPEAAQYAVDNVQADWNANALAKAKSYQESMAMSPEAIRDQLTSDYGEKFTADEADYAIQHLND
jgi:outer membrane biosynthesis protein TonB